MFFRKSKQPPARKLGDIVKRVHRSGYVFDEINCDLGASADEISKESKEILMAYGYARRAAATALYLQGYFTKDDIDYVRSIFKSIQVKTGHSVEFQEQAFADSISFMQSYHHLITAKFIRELARISRDCEIPDEKLDDNELFKEVLETLYRGDRKDSCGNGQ